MIIWYNGVEPLPPKVCGPWSELGSGRRERGWGSEAAIVRKFNKINFQISLPSIFRLGLPYVFDYNSIVPRNQSHTAECISLCAPLSISKQLSKKRIVVSSHGTGSPPVNMAVSSPPPAALSFSESLYERMAASAAASSCSELASTRSSSSSRFVQVAH